MIDTHAHIDFEQYDQDREEVIRRAFENGIEKIINVGADMEGSIGSVKLAENHEDILASVGLHPHVFNDVSEFPISNFQFPNNFQFSNDKISKLFNDLYQLAKKEKVVAIGEIGLDYYSHSENPITEEQKENQKSGFIYQIKIAEELNLPIIIHCRGVKSAEADHVPSDAYDECLEIIQNYPDQKFVFHCYGGDLEFTKKLMAKENIYFSFTGNITFAKPDSETVEVIRVIPMEKIMVETDCPFLTPVPNRGKRNEPSYVRYVCEKMAEIKEIPAKRVDEITTQNTKKFYNLA